MARVVKALLSIHPGNPLVNVSFLEIEAACRFFDCDDQPRSIAAVCDVIGAINQSLAENQTPKKPKEPWVQ